MSGVLAHSAKGSIPAQAYGEHVSRVYNRASVYAAEAEEYHTVSDSILQWNAETAALMHDLGKLDERNQACLQGQENGKKLPINHVDAGTAWLLAHQYLLPAAAVYAHHRGLPDLGAELIREENAFRDEHPNVRKEVNSRLEQMSAIHYRETDLRPSQPQNEYQGDSGMLLRMMLSCLSDADHTDTAQNYGQLPDRETLPNLRAEERLRMLDRYVERLGGDDERSFLRREMYINCREAVMSEGFSACDSPVGSGKTTAVMAHLLRQAQKRNARRVFVILPYTSIITQSVQKYRECLTLPGENPEEVVAELHSRADFQDRDVRYLSSLWRAPIVVTTAVAFFETLASNKPSALRKLHELPGSVVFLDEAHAALPVSLLPTAWRWMKILAKEWGCYFVMASGSLVRFWEIDAISEEKTAVPDLVSPVLREQLMQYEKKRICFCWHPQPLSRQELLASVCQSPGPRLLIVNTVQSAAVLANDLCRMHGREKVEHLSTALTPADRADVIERIQRRLCDPQDDDWTLVATSCVEAGVDFSFRTGFREVASLCSLLQAAGRVNRNGAQADAKMWSFTLQDDSMLKRNMGIRNAASVMQQYLRRGTEITPRLSTRSLIDEINRDDSGLRMMQDLVRKDETCAFHTVAERFKVIDSDTVAAVVDSQLAKKIAQGTGDWLLLQKHSVSIRQRLVEQWKLEEIVPGIYRWTLAYDKFLGYMAGVLALSE